MKVVFLKDKSPSIINDVKVRYSAGSPRLGTITVRLSLWPSVLHVKSCSVMQNVCSADTLSLSSYCFCHFSSFFPSNSCSGPWNPSFLSVPLHSAHLCRSNGLLVLIRPEWESALGSVSWSYRKHLWLHLCAHCDCGWRCAITCYWLGCCASHTTFAEQLVRAAWHSISPLLAFISLCSQSASSVFSEANKGLQVLPRCFWNNADVSDY